MSDNIDTRISPALHPDNIKEVEGYEGNEMVLAPTATAFSTAYEGIRAVYAARAAAEKNPAWTQEARIIQVDDFARKHLDKITRTFDSTRANLDKGIASLEGQLSGPVESKAAQGIASEIRAHVKAMKPGERQAFIQKAIDDGDIVSATAVLGAPAYLSGFDPNMQKVLLRFYHERQSPDAATRLKAMVGAKTMIEERAGLVFKELEKAVGAPPHKAKKLREAQTAAEKAFVMQAGA